MGTPFACGRFLFFTVNLTAILARRAPFSPEMNEDTPAFKPPLTNEKNFGIGREYYGGKIFAFSPLCTSGISSARLPRILRWLYPYQSDNWTRQNVP